MLTRRRFLGNSAIGLMAAATGCSLPGRTGSGEPVLSPIALSGTLDEKVRAAGYRNRVLGYPINMTMPPNEFFSWRQQLAQAGINRFAYNNVGDPFKASPIVYNTHDYEREVILRFGDRFGFSRADIWGFLSHSGTDSNMHGMYMGRTLLKARCGVVPKVYYTKEAHYSIQVLQDLLGLDAVAVSTSADGSMDPNDLERKLADHPNHPALVVATLGTTFKGAVDPVDRIREVLKTRPNYLHLDAALFGGYLPYTTHADEVKVGSAWNRDVARYDSLAVSCHKFFGFPAPAGLFITTAKIFDEFHSYYEKIHNPEYIHHVPGTITCSRDAVKPAEFYFFTTEIAQRLLADGARTMLQNTAWLMAQMQANFAHLRPVRANALSNTVYFLRPNDAIVRKYSLATMRFGEGHDQQAYAHVVVMPHADRAVLTEFLTDLATGVPAARV